MRSIFSLVSLLVVLAIVGVLVTRHMKDGTTPSYPLSSSALPGAPTGTPAEQSRQLQEKVRVDMNKAIEDANAARDKAIEDAK